MSVRVLINGEPGTEHVDFRDRGLAYGDGLFETLAVRNGAACLLSRHLKRLALGCLRLGIPVQSSEQLQSEIERLLEEGGNGVLKIILTRGIGARGYSPITISQATRILSFQETPVAAENRGLRVVSCRSRLGCNPQLAGLKHLNRLEQVLAAREVAEAAADEGVVCDSQGRVIEGVSSNIYLVSGSRIITPRLDNAGVKGITRELVAEQAAALDMEFKERDVQSAELFGCDALLFSNSVQGLRWARSLDNCQYPDEKYPSELLNLVNRAAFDTAE